MERASLLDVIESSTLYPEVLEKRLAPRSLHARTHVASIASPLHQWRNALLKRAADLIASTVLILLVFPWFLPLVSLLILLDSRGPVFFRQRRHKKNGGEFLCLKLRTMLANAEADTRSSFEGDERITRLGRLLRRTHLDELPQLVNVWLGDMSLVGPRPHMLSENEAFAGSVPGYHLRHRVKPGITGLAQVRGYVGATKNTAEMGLRLHADLYYIRHWSARMDAHIIWSTFRGFFQKRKQKTA
jgi:putative colanic acid biosynthesis UDP-glucose lipid carrier transferase